MYTFYNAFVYAANIIDTSVCTAALDVTKQHLDTVHVSVKPTH